MRDTIIHWAEYIPYTGVYALCVSDHPEFDSCEFKMSRLLREIDCPECLKKLEELRQC